MILSRKIFLFFIVSTKNNIAGIVLICILFPFLVNAQKISGKYNMPSYDQKRYHFGISLGLNVSDFKISLSEKFIHHDSILVVESSKGPGFNLGIVADLPIGDYFDLRFIPSLSFADKGLNYTMKQRDTLEDKGIESVYLDFPILLKFKSERIGNWRVYVLAGLEYGNDMASNAKARKAADKVKIIRNDFMYNYGAGFDFYFPMFKLSIELKMSHGMNNILAEDSKLIYSDVIQKLTSRTYLLSFHFE